MLVAPRSVEASLIARRLERWGAQTCTISDIAVAQALIPERAWHAILVDGAMDHAAVTQLGELAQPHAPHRLIMFTPSMRHDYPPTAMAGFTGYLVKPLRAASLAARLSAPAPALAPSIADLDDAEDQQASASGTTRSPHRLTILLAEDNEINALLMRTLLTRMGHQVVLTTNGEAALESWLGAEAAGTPYDLVLMDVQMPRLDGIEATRQIRAREAGQRVHRTPILALTANALVEDRYACFEAGMDGFLVKPLDRDKLTEVLASLKPIHTLAA
jgi:CheY-like chemotaxis protein